MIGIKFDHDFVMNEDSYVNVFPKFADVNFDFGFTICLRAKFEFWSESTIFNSDQISLQMNDFKDPGGLIETADYNNLAFKWPDEKILFYNSWNSFCLTIDQDSSYSLTINGNAANITEDKSSEKTPFVGLESIYLGYFIGQLTDLNVWNLVLSPAEMREFAAGCDENIFESRPPLSVKWGEVNMTESGNVSTKFQLNRTAICSSLTSNYEMWIFNYVIGIKA